VKNIKGLYKDSPSHRNHLHQWERIALEKFEAKMKNKAQPFPCIPATIGFRLNQIRYGYAGDPREASTKEEVAGMLREYALESKKIGPYTSLIIFYETPQPVIDTYSVEGFEQLFWQQLNDLAEMDEREWPQHIPVDPHSPIWEFCFNGEPYFMYCASPSHQNRKSRHFDYFMLAITPRWVLNEFNKSEIYAAKIKSQVRKRLRHYDSIGIHPDLNAYGNDDNNEWRQYFLRDDDTSLSKCPFHNSLKLNE
jgi:uncharacterized protein